MLKLFKPYGNCTLEKERVGDLVDIYDLKRFAEFDHAEALRMGLAQADLLMGDVEVAVTDTLLEAAPRVRAVVCRTIGVDFVDVEAATKRGILVLNSPMFCVTAVAEYALTCMLCMAHRLPQAVRVMNDGDWEARESLRGIELCSKTLGLVGLGRIGHELARMAIGLGMEVVAYDPYVKQPDIPVRLASLEEVLVQADVLSIHSPLTPQTRGMIGQKQLELMKRSAILTNVSRGGIVDETALMEALKNGRIAAAALDVLTREPTQPGDVFHQAYMENLLLTPHAAWNTYEGFIRNQETFGDQIECLASGRVPTHGIVNPQVLPAWCERWNVSQL